VSIGEAHATRNTRPKRKRKGKGKGAALFSIVAVPIILSAACVLYVFSGCMNYVCEGVGRREFSGATAAKAKGIQRERNRFQLLRNEE
jgi:hypothetical protein